MRYYLDSNEKREYVVSDLQECGKTIATFVYYSDARMFWEIKNGLTITLEVQK